MFSSCSHPPTLHTYLSPEILQSLESDDCLDTRDTKSVLEGESFRSIRFGFANKLLPYLLLDIFTNRCRGSKSRIQRKRLLRERSAHRKIASDDESYRIHTQPVGFTLCRALELQAFTCEPGVCTAGAGTRARTTTFPTTSATNAV